MRSPRAAAFALVLLVLGQLGAMSHDAAVRHVRCAAHDELVEAPAVDLHRNDATRLVGLAGSAGADEHCELAAARTSHAVHISAPMAAAPLALAIAAVSAPIEAIATAAVTAYAPKTSPPDATT